MNKLLKEINYNLSSKWRSFTYIFRRPFYILRLYKRFLKHPYYGAWGMTENMLEIPFEMFCEFYEKGQMWKICYDDPPWKEVKAEMDFLYKWYKEIKPQKEKEEDVLLGTWSEHHTVWLEPTCNDSSIYHSKTSGYGMYLSGLLDRHESEFEQEKEEMLIRLVKIRRFLWT